MRAHPLLLSTVLVLIGGAVSSGAEELAVVVHPSAAPLSVGLDELAALFLKRQTYWRDGQLAEPIHQASGSAARRDFSRVVLGLEPESADEEARRNALRSGWAVPPELASDQEVLLWVARRAGAVGYVDVSALDGADVRILTVEGCSLCARPADAFDGFDGVGDRVPSSPVSLEVAGACGKGGERMVVTSSGARDPVTVELERSRWRRGRRISTRRERIRLAPGEEKPLGCAAGGVEDGERFEVVGVSDERSGSPPENGETAPRARPPARSRLAVLPGATCGPDGKGHELRLVSRAGQDRIAADVEIHEELVDVAGSGSSRTFRRQLHLGPGRSEDLGCSRQGKLARRVVIVEARWEG